jgi:hypothetical protein
LGPFDGPDELSVRFPIEIDQQGVLEDLFAMTPYRWHAPRDIGERLAAAISPLFVTTADVRVALFRRRSGA